MDLTGAGRLWRRRGHIRRGRRWERMALSYPRTLFAYFLLFAALYAGFGVQSPYLPRLLQEHGLRAETIGVVLAAGTAIRLAAGPIAGSIADRLDAPTLVFAGCAAGAALTSLGYLAAGGFWPIFAVTLLQASALAPLAPLGDSLVLAAAAPHGVQHRPGFDYGWVRGAGSGAFILGLMVSGQVVDRHGLTAIVWLNAALLGAAALLAPAMLRLPRAERSQCAAPMGDRGNVLALFRLPAFRRVVLVAALMFLFFGRPLLNRIGPSGAALLAAFAGMLRWGVEAETAWLPTMALIQPLHGITFALLHLGCMQRLAESVPPRLAATALTVYGTLGIGAATALMTLASGSLYGAVGPSGFWVMAALCAVALPIARRL